MKVVKINKLGDDLIEVEFDNGTKSQMKPSELASVKSPADFKSEVRELLANDSGKGGEKYGKRSQ